MESFTLVSLSVLLFAFIPLVSPDDRWHFDCMLIRLSFDCGLNEIRRVAKAFLVRILLLCWICEITPMPFTSAPGYWTLQTINFQKKKQSLFNFSNHSRFSPVTNCDWPAFQFCFLCSRPQNRFTSELGNQLAYEWCNFYSLRASLCKYWMREGKKGKFQNDFL